MTTATKEKCDICGKECKSVERHKAAMHQEPPDEEIKVAQENLEDVPEHPSIQEIVDLKAKITDLEAQLADKKVVGKSVEDIAKILYEDIVKPLGEAKGFDVKKWGEFDPADYLKVARKIKG